MVLAGAGSHCSQAGFNVYDVLAEPHGRVINKSHCLKCSTPCPNIIVGGLEELDCAGAFGFPYHVLLCYKLLGILIHLRLLLLEPKDMSSLNKE